MERKEGRKFFMLEFYHEKFESIRKEKGPSINKLCNLIGISRVSYWKWKNGIQIPKEGTIRLLAETLGILVSEISNLTDSHPISDVNFQQKYNSWESLSKGNSKIEYKKKITDSLKTLLDLNEKLESTQILIDAVLSSIDSMVYLKDNNLNYIIANDKFLKNASLSEEYNIYKKNDTNIFPKKEAKVNTEDDEFVLQSGRQLQKEGYIPCSRKKKWGLITKSPVFDAKNKIAGIVGNIIDLTEKKAFEEKQELLNLYVENMSLGLIVYGFKNKTILYANKKVFDIFGYPEEKIYDLHDYKKGLNLAFYPEDKKIIESFFETFDNRPKVMEFKICRGSDHCMRWIEVTSTEKKMFKGKECNIAVISDITERKEIELRKELLESIIGKADECVWIGRDNKVLYINNAFERMTGLKEAELINNYEIWLSLIHPDDKKKIEKFLQLEKYPKKIVYRIIRKTDNGIRLISESCYAENGIYFGIAKDITNEKNCYE